MYTGYNYYSLPLEERFYHPKYDWFKPAGIMGHGLGIIGTFLILFGVVIYILRKRYNFFSRFIRLKYLLEFHIFLCSLGSILVLFHTSFKFGGIVSIAFWSMVAVVLSGIIGRFIYIQIPRTIEGRELSLHEVKTMSDNLQQSYEETLGKNKEIKARIEYATTLNSFSPIDYLKTKFTTLKIKNLLSDTFSSSEKTREIYLGIKEEIKLKQRIKRLEYMQQLFKYWHVAHMPFALIMLIIVLIHVAVTLALGYKWIF